MTRTVSPGTFARRQLLAAWAPWIVFALIVVGFGLGTAALAHGSPVLHVALAALLFLCTGGVALGYAAAWVWMIHRGFVPTPRTPWRVELRGGAAHGDVVHIATATRETDVPRAALAAVTLLSDDAWDRMNGMETHCLVLHRAGGPRISIPGSSEGFDALLAALRRTMRVDRVSV